MPLSEAEGLILFNPLTINSQAIVLLHIHLGGVSI